MHEKMMFEDYHNRSSKHDRLMFSLSIVAGFIFLALLGVLL